MHFNFLETFYKLIKNFFNAKNSITNTFDNIIFLSIIDEHKIMGTVLSLEGYKSLKVELD